MRESGILAKKTAKDKAYFEESYRLECIAGRRLGRIGFS